MILSGKTLSSKTAAAAVAAALAAAVAGARAEEAGKNGDGAPPEYYGRIEMRVAGMLQRYHVRQKPFGESQFSQTWSNLVSYYDFDHSVFLQSDLDALAERRETLRSEITNGDVSFGFDIYHLFKKRLKERLDYATNLLAKGEWDFSKEEFYRVKRKDAPWPATVDEAQDHWRRRMKNELLAITLSREIDAEKEAAKKKNGEAETGEGNEAKDAGKADSKPQDTPTESLIKKYRQYGRTLTEPDDETILQAYMSAFCRSSDPHSDYMSPLSKEDFGIEMSHSLEGVGAELTMDDDGSLKISRIVHGSPLDLDGRIEAGDKITGVQQEGGEMEDITWKPMRKSIRKIRGKKGTKVTLEIIPGSDREGATRKRYEIVRDKVNFDEQAATGHVEKVVLDGRESKIGYIYLPAFYGTMDKRPGDEGYLSCAADVGRILAGFNSDGVEALVLDLRGNGGGSLKEAVELSALFVSGGPVVVVRDARVAMPLAIPRGNPVAFRKPVVVLIDKASASASEIVAAHLRDTGRAVIAGDIKSHGKGTVQSVFGLGPEKYGQMKITTQRFYRINGKSTQLEGIKSDIHLPSFLDSLDIGEEKLANALPFSEIPPARYSLAWDLDKYIPRLAEASAARTAADGAFQRHLANVAATGAAFERETVPLEREARKALMKKDREIESDSMDDGGETDSPSSAGADEKTGDRKGKSRRRRRAGIRDDDVVLKEALNIAADLVRLTGGEEMPPAAPLEWYDAILGL